MKPIPPLTLDVRPLLAAGKEPLSAIIESKSQLTPGQTLRLLAPFEPKPLYLHFESDGFSIESRQMEASYWEISFIPPSAGTEECSRRLDLCGITANEFLTRGTEAVTRLTRGRQLELLSSDRPTVFLSELNINSTDYDCEKSEDGEYWISTIWRL